LSFSKLTVSYFLSVNLDIKYMRITRESRTGVSVLFQDFVFSMTRRNSQDGTSRFVSSQCPGWTFNLITIPRCVRFTMYRPHAMVPDENYIALVVAVLRQDRMFSYFPEMAQCEPYITT